MADINVKVKVDRSELDDFEKKTKGKDVEINTKVSGQEDVKQTTTNVEKMTTAAQKSNGVFATLKGKISETFSSAKIATTAYLATLYSIQKAGRAAVKSIEEIDSAIVDLQIATNGTYEDTKKLVASYNEMAQDLKATTTQVTSAADDWLRAGKSMSEANDLIQKSLMLSKLGKLDSAESTEDLLAVMNGLNMSVDQVGRALDAMVAIDMEASTSSGDIATALKYCASSADVAGISFNKLAASIGTVQDKTQQSAETVGTFENTLLSRYRDITIGKYLSDDGEDISNYESVLKSIGIQLRDSSGEFRDFEIVMDEMAEKWDSLSSVQQAAVAKVASGTRQQNRFFALMEGYDKVLELTEVAANSAGTALDKYNNSYLNSIEAKKNQLQASFESLIFNTNAQEGYKSILDITNAIVQLADKTNLLKGAFAGLLTAGAIKGFTSLKTGIMSAYVELNNFNNALKLS